MTAAPLTPAPDVVKVHRRGFLKGLFSAGALVLAAPLVPRNAMAAVAWMPSVYFGLEPDGTVVLVAHRSEMGTGIRTALPMVAADELGADWAKVRIEQAIGDEKYGSQNTDGSCSIRDFYDTVRDAAATARTMLERAAAQQWSVPASECKATGHEVVHQGSGRKLAFGALVTSAAKLPAPKQGEFQLRSASEFRYIGKGVPVVDQSDLISGKGTFGYDAKVPHMLYASIERPPVVGGSIKSVDDAAAKAVKGVVSTAKLDTFTKPYGFKQLGGVAVLADSTWAALQGRKKLKVEWNAGDNAVFDSTTFKQQLSQTVRAPQKNVRSRGDVDKAFASASKTHEAEYYVPMLAHAAMEPPAAVAEFKNGKVTAWTCTQNPQAVQEAVAGALGIQKTDVICNVTLLGGGFGRKSKPDYVVEAALLSKQVGRPVKVSWTREDDLQFDYYHGVAAVYCKAAIGGNGKPEAWLQRSAYPSLWNLFAADTEYASDVELGLGYTDLPYNIPNLRAENGPAKAHVRIGWLRSVCNIQHAFAQQSFTDELARLAGRDPVEYYLDVLGPARIVDFTNQQFKHWNYGKGEDQFPFDAGRLRRVVELVAEKSGWANKKSGSGRGWGFAAHRSFLTYVATVVEVEVDAQGRLRIPTVHMAVDAGRIIHPDRVVSQFEGASVFGAGAAMLGEMTFAGGRANQRNFGQYQLARINEAPRTTHVHLVNSDAPPAGVGEPGVPPMAPAICNAVFSATGKRIRELPLKRAKLV